MARKKVNLQWIANDSTRRATFKKRRMGLMKKVSELATLCGAKACVVVYGEGEAQPEVWPSVPDAKRILNRFKAMPELSSLKRMHNQEDFLRSRISKLHDQVCKSYRENRDRDTSYLLHETMVRHRPGFVGVTVEELSNLCWMVERKIKIVKERLQQLVVRQGAPLEPPLPSVRSSSQPLFPHTSTEIYTPEPAEEPSPQPQQQEWRLMDRARNEGELGAAVCSTFACSSSSSCAAGLSGASTSGGWGDMMQSSNLAGSGFSWSWNPFHPME